MGRKALLTVVCCLALSDALGEAEKKAIADSESAESAPPLYRNIPSAVYASGSPYGAYSFHKPAVINAPIHRHLAPAESVVIHNTNGLLRNLKDSYGKLLASPQTAAYKSAVPQQYVELQALPAHLVAAAPAIQYKQNAPQYFFGSQQYRIPSLHQSATPTPITRFSGFSQPSVYAENIRSFAPSSGYHNVFGGGSKSFFGNSPSIQKIQQKPSANGNHDAKHQASYNDKGQIQAAQAQTSVTAIVNGKKTVITLDTQPPIPLVDLSLLEPLHFDNPIVPQVQHFLPKINAVTYKKLPQAKGCNNCKKKNKEILVQKTVSYDSGIIKGTPQIAKPPKKAHPKPQSKPVKPSVVVKGDPNGEEFSYEIDTPNHKETYNEQVISYKKKTNMKPVTYSYNENTKSDPVTYSFTHNSKEPLKIQHVEYGSDLEKPKTLIYTLSPEEQEEEEQSEEVRESPKVESEDSGESSAESEDEPPVLQQQREHHAQQKESPKQSSHELQEEEETPKYTHNNSNNGHHETPKQSYYHSNHYDNPKHAQYHESPSPKHAQYHGDHHEGSPKHSQYHGEHHESSPKHSQYHGTHHGGSPKHSGYHESHHDSPKHSQYHGQHHEESPKHSHHGDHGGHQGSPNYYQGDYSGGSPQPYHHSDYNAHYQVAPKKNQPHGEQEVPSHQLKKEHRTEEYKQKPKEEVHVEVIHPSPDYYSQPLTIPKHIQNQYQPITPEYEEDIRLLPTHKPNEPIKVDPNQHVQYGPSTPYHERAHPSPAPQKSPPANNHYESSEEQDDEPYNAPHIIEKSKRVIIKEKEIAPDEMHTHAEQLMNQMIEQEENNEAEFEKAYKDAAFGFEDETRDSADPEKEIYNPAAYGVPKYQEYQAEPVTFQQYQEEGDEFPNSARSNYKDIRDKNTDEYYSKYTALKPESFSDRYQKKDDYYKTYKQNRPEHLFENEDKKEKKKEKYIIASPSYVYPAQKQKPQQFFAQYKIAPKINGFDYSKGYPVDSSAFASRPYQKLSRTHFVEPQFQYGFEPMSAPLVIDSELAAMASNDSPESEKPGMRKKVHQESWYIKKTSTVAGQPS